MDERLKKICKKWNENNGLCPFGNDCKYSHRSNYELSQFVEQIKQSRLFISCRLR